MSELAIPPRAAPVTSMPTRSSERPMPFTGSKKSVPSSLVSGPPGPCGYRPRRRPSIVWYVVPGLTTIIVGPASMSAPGAPPELDGELELALAG